MIQIRSFLISFLLSSGLVFFCCGCRAGAPPDLRIPVVMKKFSIDPAEIRVPGGKRIELDVTTADVQHGFDIPELGIKEPVQPGRTAVITFTAPAKGEYRISCGVICGPHHDDMTGKLIVQ